MKALSFSLFTGFLLCLLPSCIIPAYFTSHESARTLGKGTIEVNASISHHSLPNIEDGLQSFHGRVGYGVSDRFDLKFEFTTSTLLFEGMALAKSKLSLVENRLSLGFDAGVFYTSFLDWDVEFYSLDDIDIYLGTNTKPGLVLNPKLYLSTPIGQNADLYFVPQLAYMTLESSILCPGGNIGVDFLTQSRNWSITPEVGYLYVQGLYHQVNFGIGTSFYLPGN